MVSATANHARGSRSSRMSAPEARVLMVTTNSSRCSSSTEYRRNPRSPDGPKWKSALVCSKPGLRRKCRA